MKKLILPEKYQFIKAVLDGTKTQEVIVSKIFLRFKTIHGNYKIVFPEEVLYEDGGWWLKYKYNMFPLPKCKYPTYNLGDVVPVYKNAKDENPCLYVKINGIWIDRIQNITIEDCLKQGLIKDTDSVNPERYNYSYYGSLEWFYSPKDAYKTLFEARNGRKSWKKNPFVWIYNFELIKDEQKEQDTAI